MKSLSNHELGVQLNYKEWDENGNLIVDEKLKPDDDAYEILLMRREDFKTLTDKSINN